MYWFYFLLGQYYLLDKLLVKTVVGKKFYTSQLDELQILKNETKLITDKDRFKIIQKAKSNDNDVIIFDDGLQDKNIYYNVAYSKYLMKISK